MTVRTKTTSAGSTRPAAPAKAGARPRTVARAQARAAAKAGKELRGGGTSLNAKLTWGLVAVVVAALVGLFIYAGSRPSASEQAIAEHLVRDDSHRLGTAGAEGADAVTIVEFLDFECPSCAAAYPGVEKLRAEYGDKINYVVRFFPISSHPNARTAAAAAHAAAQQDAFEPMYHKLFQTQSSWAGTDGAQATFEGYAAELGLDLDRFRADMADPATAAFVDRDQADGAEIGVTGTPTFFIDGKKFNGVPSYQELKAVVDSALR